MESLTQNCLNFAPCVQDEIFQEMQYAKDLQSDFPVRRVNYILSIISGETVDIPKYEEKHHDSKKLSVHLRYIHLKLLNLLDLSTDKVIDNAVKLDFYTKAIDEETQKNNSLLQELKENKELSTYRKKTLESGIALGEKQIESAALHVKNIKDEFPGIIEDIERIKTHSSIIMLILKSSYESLRGTKIGNLLRENKNLWSTEIIFSCPKSFPQKLNMIIQQVIFERMDAMGH